MSEYLGRIEGLQSNGQEEPRVAGVEVISRRVERSEKLTNRGGGTMSKRHSKVFIASSTEGLRVANAIKNGLEYGFESTIWTQGVFDPGSYVLEQLIAQTKQKDFAIFVVDADDVTRSRDQDKRTTRDNVILELGLFIGALGLSRCFMVFDRERRPDLPTDLLGVTPVDYRVYSDENYDASVGSAVSRLSEAMSKLGPLSKDSAATDFVGRDSRVSISVRDPNSLHSPGPILSNTQSGALYRNLAKSWSFMVEFSYIKRVPDPGSGNVIGSVKAEIPTTWTELLVEAGRFLYQGVSAPGLVVPMARLANRVIVEDGSYFPPDFERSNGVSVGLEPITDVLAMFEGLGLVRRQELGTSFSERQWEFTDLGIRTYSELIGSEGAKR
ncbi:nucleotide-binding protein [Nakamurella flava]|uniref:nucleotide-binding protein n=1 Tax=Nakamurella flava TaxID=2576308 RepID=UPI0014097F58|nr:nucleotide-binding protein [Nakamurella flava]